MDRASDSESEGHWFDSSRGRHFSSVRYSKSAVALAFHHVNPADKDPEFAAMRNWSWTRIESELKKCILVCRNCHAEIHEDMKIDGA